MKNDETRDGANGSLLLRTSPRAALGTHSFASRALTRSRAAAASGCARLTRKGAGRHGGTRFALKGSRCGAGSPPRRAASGSATATILRCFFSHPGRGTFARRRKIYSGTTRLEKPNSDGLFRVARAVFAFSDVLNLFAHEFAGLSGMGFPFPGILMSALNGTFFGHTRLLLD